MAYIEEHRCRLGRYPDRISDVGFMAMYDREYFEKHFTYERLEDGYSIDLRDPVPEKVSLDEVIPADFWDGIGLKRSNMRSSR